ncbi:hypothetical protein ABCR94_13910 [Streptomyces sp. 21So2-11]|uniref:hypothetical protein n=1 Tax=Streptomyces sp. 21So2-11 TaxID=3144408 RepID=UPI003219654D
MTGHPHHHHDDVVHLPRPVAERMASWLRHLEAFLDDCDQATADALDGYFGFAPAAETISAVLSLDADTLQAALTTTTPPPQEA